MAPYFIRNLIPRREARGDNRRPLLEVLRTITWVQWAQFLSGYAPFTLTLSIMLEGLATVWQMAGVVLRRDRLFQRIAQRHSPPKTI